VLINTPLKLITGAVAMAALIFFVYQTGNKNGVNKCELAISKYRLQVEAAKKDDEARRQKEVKTELDKVKHHEDGTLAPVLRATLDGMRTRNRD